MAGMLPSVWMNMSGVVTIYTSCAGNTVLFAQLANRLHSARVYRMF